MPTSDQFAASDINAETPVLRSFRVVLTDGGRPIEAQVLVKAGYSVELEYRLRQPDGEPGRALVSGTWALLFDGVSSCPVDDVGCRPGGPGSSPSRRRLDWMRRESAR